MKHVKKLASLLLALVMVCALATTAFAADETGSITVDNPIEGQTYIAYKIFDVTYNTGKTAYSYTINSTDPWFTAVSNYAKTENSGLTLTEVPGSAYLTVSITDKFSAPKFAEALQQALDDDIPANLAGQGKELKVKEGKATATDLPLGYYFVTSTSGALCNLTTTDPNATIHDKNDVPFKKKGSYDTVDVGGAVYYTITGKVPDYTGFTTYTYLITDTMSAGLTFRKDVIVHVGDEIVTSECTVTYDVGGNANKFTVSIPVMNYTIGAEIVVSYSAAVNENAIAKIENNHAVLEYSNDPTDSSKTTTTPPQEAEVYTSKIVIDKYQAGNENTKLAGAKFVLYGVGVGVDHGTHYYMWDETGKRVVWTDRAHATIVTTDANGAASFNGLADGTYYLEEIEAPAGYNQLTEPVTVTVNGANATKTDLSSLTVTAKVANSTGATLPETGGMGTTLFYTLGAILVLGAGVLLVTKKRMSTEK